MRENTDQEYSEYGRFLRNDYYLLHFTLQTKKINLKSGISIMKTSHYSTGTKYWRTYVRSNQWSFSMKKYVLKSFAIFTWKNMWWRLFLITLQGFRPATLLKRDWNTGVCVPVNIAKFSRTPILKNILEQLLLIGKIF